VLTRNPAPQRLPNSTRTLSPEADTDTVTAPPGTAEPLCRTLLATSSLAARAIAPGWRVWAWHGSSRRWPGQGA
jgi:hypothetical protein